jgi:hypothetical protein
MRARSTLVALSLSLLLASLMLTSARAAADALPPPGRPEWPDTPQPEPAPIPLELLLVVIASAGAAAAWSGSRTERRSA